MTKRLKIKIKSAGGTNADLDIDRPSYASLVWQAIRDAAVFGGASMTAKEAREIAMYREESDLPMEIIDSLAGLAKSVSKAHNNTRGKRIDEILTRSQVDIDSVFGDPARNAIAFRVATNRAGLLIAQAPNPKATSGWSRLLDHRAVEAACNDAVEGCRWFSSEWTFADAAFAIAEEAKAKAEAEKTTATAEA